jgi:hypothetical protein
MVAPLFLYDCIPKIIISMMPRSKVRLNLFRIIHFVIRNKIIYFSVKKMNMDLI